MGIEGTSGQEAHECACLWNKKRMQGNAPETNIEEPIIHPPPIAVPGLGTGSVEPQKSRKLVESRKSHKEKAVPPVPCALLEQAAPPVPNTLGPALPRLCLRSVRVMLPLLWHWPGVWQT